MSQHESTSTAQQGRPQVRSGPNLASACSATSGTGGSLRATGIYCPGRWARTPEAPKRWHGRTGLRRPRKRGGRHGLPTPRRGHHHGGLSGGAVCLEAGAFEQPIGSSALRRSGGSDRVCAPCSSSWTATPNVVEADVLDIDGATTILLAVHVRIVILSPSPTKRVSRDGHRDTSANTIWRAPLSGCPVARTPGARI